jgi:arylsulfatase A-like enzyme
LAVAPFLLWRASSRQQIADVWTKVAVTITVFVSLGLVLWSLLASFIGLTHFSRISMRLAFALYSLAFAGVLWFPRRRKQVVASLDGALGGTLGEKPTRRAAIATGIASAALVAGELSVRKTVAAKTRPVSLPRRTGPNVLLITFDALSAEDMSLYGYRLPTTPNIDEFARRSTAFTNFYSASNFTTPCVASMLTGLYPSDHRVYHLEGSLARGFAAKNLPHLMRSGGYSVGASINNPVAYFLAEGIMEDFDYLPKPPHRPDNFANLWDATEVLHRPQPYGSRLREYEDLEDVSIDATIALRKMSPSLTGSPHLVYSPGASFAQAREYLNGLPDGFFLWVHTLAPHSPYLPEAPYLGRFLDPGARLQNIGANSFPRYALSDQKNVDDTRLRYDELVAQTDGAFGAFMSELERSGRLRDTAVIVSADHGESFEGGFFSHAYPFQTRPVLHIPLIVRMPGQEQGYRIAHTTDQTSLAPTILDIARLPQPVWMPGQSLVPLLNGVPENYGENQGGGLAFTQYLATNSLFKPLNSGTVGVIDGQHQYVLDLATGTGKLRGLAEAQICDLDRSVENPALAQTLRETIYRRFPNLPRKQA